MYRTCQTFQYYGTIFYQEGRRFISYFIKGLLERLWIFCSAKFAGLRGSSHKTPRHAKARIPPPPSPPRKRRLRSRSRASGLLWLIRHVTPLLRPRSREFFPFDGSDDDDEAKWFSSLIHPWSIHFRVLIRRRMKRCHWQAPLITRDRLFLPVEEEYVPNSHAI